MTDHDRPLHMRFVRLDEPYPERAPVTDASCLPPVEPLFYADLTIRFCTSWDFIDWNRLVAPRWTWLAHAVRKPGRRVKTWWRNR